MNLADYEHMLAGLDADIAASPLGQTVQPLKDVQRGTNTAIE